MSTANLRQTTLAVTSPYGWRILKKTGQKNLHKGTDFPFGRSTPVSAFGSGTVVESGKHYEYGNYLKIQHAPGIETSYHSLDKPARFKKGEWVNMGDTVGFGGTSALGATGAHCHVGLWLNGQHVNLENYLTPGKVVTISNTGSVTSGNVTPFPNTPPTPTAPSVPAAPERKKDMFIHWDNRVPAGGWFCTAFGREPIRTIADAQLLERFISGKQDTFNLAQWDIIDSYVFGAQGRVTDRQQANLTTIRGDLAWLDREGPNSNRVVLEQIAKIEKPQVDTASIEKVVADAIAKQGVTVNIDNEAIAKAVLDEQHRRTES